MAGHNLTLAFDLAAKSLVAFQGSTAALPPFRQSKYLCRIYIVERDLASPGRAYDTIDYTAWDSLRLGLWSASTGYSGDSDSFLLALTDTLGWTLETDADGYEFFSGEFNVNTIQVADFLAGQRSRAAFFAVNLVSGNQLCEVFDHRGSQNATIYSATDEFSGVAIDVTQPVNQIRLPLQILDPDSGELYALTRVSPGVLQWVWQNAL